MAGRLFWEPDGHRETQLADGQRKDIGVQREWCCLSIFESGVINNDGVLDNYLLMRDPSSAAPPDLRRF
jgi:hypothetical protein